MLPDPYFPNPALPEGILSGKTVLITGASSGIGAQIARRCAAAGANLVLVGRDKNKTSQVAEKLHHETGNNRIFYEIADLLHLNEQADLSARILSRYDSIYALINNAGALFLDHKLTKDGIERTMALNHLATFNLSIRLLQALVNAYRRNEPSRIINIASRAHWRAKPILSDMSLQDGSTGWDAYSRSKLANILFTRSLADRIPGTVTTVHAVHPGVVASGFALNNGFFGKIQRSVMNIFSVSEYAGSDTAAWLTASDEGKNTTGLYWSGRKQRNVSQAAKDRQLGENLWTTSCNILGIDADNMIEHIMKDRS